MRAQEQLERIMKLKNRWAFNYGAWYDRIIKLQNRWVFNYNPWHDELGRFTFAGHGTFVLPSTSIAFNPNTCLRKVGNKDVRLDYSKLAAEAPYRPDKSAVAISNKYQNGMSKDINIGLREVRNAMSAKERMDAFNTKIFDTSGIARVPGESGNYLYTSTAVRNLSRTIAFHNTEDMKIYRGISGDHFARAQKGAKYVINDFCSSSTSATMATDFAARRQKQDGFGSNEVATVYTINVPRNTGMAIPTYTQISGGTKRSGITDESEVLLPPSTVVRVDKVGNAKTVKLADGSTQRVREVTLTVEHQSTAAEELASGDYSRYEKDE